MSGLHAKAQVGQQSSGLWWSGSFPDTPIALRGGFWCLVKLNSLGDDLCFAFWNCGEEVLAVAFVDYSAVEDDYDAGVGLAAD